MSIAKDLLIADKESFKFRLERLKEIKSLYLWKERLVRRTCY